LGLFDRFRKQEPKHAARPEPAPSLFDTPQTPPPRPVVPSASPATPQAAAPAPPPPERGPVPAPSAPVAFASAPASTGFGVQRLTKHAQWIGPGTRTKVAGYAVPGGMLYVGRGLQAPRGGTEPAQIDPTLKVATRGVDVANARMGYWPSYDRISPQARGGYLTWLADGRRDPRADIGFAFLFLYGLERRALVDIPSDKRLNAELEALRSEVQRLLGIYGSNGSFRGYAARFLNVLDLQLAEHSSAESGPPPLDAESRWEPPLRLRVEPGAMASDGRPVPAGWAMAWAWYHPEIHLRTPATRCTKEFIALFESRYRAAHGDGIRVKPGKSTIRIDYYSASSGIGSAELSMGVPDVFTMAAPRKQLDKIVESVTADLDAYSRFLGRNPEGKGSIAAAALLPEDLAGEPSPEVTALIDWASGLAESRAAARGADLLALWPAKSPEKLAKAEAVTLATLLARHRLGLEPDVRLGGPAITTASKVVTFRTGTDAQPQTATPAYAGAATLLHLATAVAAADGHVSPEEQQHLVQHLERALDLTLGERGRLEAHMRWLAATGVKLTGLTKRVEVLSAQQRASIGDLLVAVAAADGVLSPDEVTSLSKIFKLLGLDPAEVHSRLHALLAGGRPLPATKPVTVREAGAPDPGYPITTRGMAPTEPAEESFALDAEVIQAKFAETAAVGALLADIFNEDEPEAAAAPSPALTVIEDSAVLQSPAAPAAPAFEGLDPAHSQFLRALLAQGRWSRGELEELAEEHNLMPDGALDTINEYALDVAGEPLLEEDDPDTFTVNDYAREELPA
jgi:tellurite resistance protein